MDLVGRRALSKAMAAAIVASGLVVVIVGGGLILLGVPTGVPVTETYSFDEALPPSSNGTTSLFITNVNGGVRVFVWDGTGALINGTVSAQGIGASVHDVKLQVTNDDGSLTFEPDYPSTTAFSGRAYGVEINVYLPKAYTFETVEIETVNGPIQVHSLTVTESVDFFTVNGDVVFDTLSAPEATIGTVNGGITGNLSRVSPDEAYIIATTNGGISVGVPANASYRLTINTVNGGVQTSGLVMRDVIQMSNHDIRATVGGGSPSGMLSLVTVNGGVSISVR